MPTMSAPRALDLARILDEELELYGLLLGIAQRERAAIVGRDPALLTAITVEKETVVARIAAADGRREAWIAEWAAANGREAEGLTLATLGEHLPGVEATAIGQRRDALISRLRDVAEVNYRNGQLVESSLRLVDRAIVAFSGLRDSALYQPTGARDRSSRTIVLDYRA